MKNLKGFRKAAGLTQVRSAKQSGVSLFRIVMAETEGIELRPEEIAAIRRILGPELAKSISLAIEFQAST
jgi:DNA-binding XRE family transcriptional regulator